MLFEVWSAVVFLNYMTDISQVGSYRALTKGEGGSAVFFVCSNMFILFSFEMCKFCSIIYLIKSRVAYQTFRSHIFFSNEY